MMEEDSSEWEENDAHEDDIEDDDDGDENDAIIHEKDDILPRDNI